MAGLGFPQVSAFPLSRCASFSSWDTLVFFPPRYANFSCRYATPPTCNLFLTAWAMLSSLGTHHPMDFCLSCGRASFPSRDTLVFHLDMLVFSPLGTPYLWIYQLSPGYATFSSLDMLYFSLSGYISLMDTPFPSLNMLVFRLWTCKFVLWTGELHLPRFSCAAAEPPPSARLSPRGRRPPPTPPFPLTPRRGGALSL